MLTDPKHRVTIVFERRRGWPPPVGEEIRMYWGDSIHDGYAVAVVDRVEPLRSDEVVPG